MESSGAIRRLTVGAFAFAVLGAAVVPRVTAQAPGGSPTPAGAAPAQNQVPRPEDVAATMAALPDAAPARPRQPRKVLVLGKAAGFVHSSIPIAARAVLEMGRKTGAWTTTITYDPADVNEKNLAQYDAIFLASTTGAFLDDPNDAAATAARRKALLDFVRGGKGIAGVHAACDSYHKNAALPVPPPPARPARGNGQGPATDLTPDQQVGTWPEFNRMMGAFFKWHWNDGQQITVKLDEPGHPLNAPFEGKSWDVVDETYTFGRDTYSRQNLRVLTSVDYAKMSPEDKAKENNPRADGDYALSWVRSEGKGRVFYEALGHNERIYANKLVLAHVLAGIQFVLGDLEAASQPR